MSESFFDTGFLGQEVLWGVTIWRLAAALVIIFFGFLSRRIISWVFRGLLKRQAQKTAARWDDDLVDFAAPPVALLAQIGLWHVAAAVILLPTEPLDLRGFVFQGLEIAIAVGFVWLAFRLLDVAAGAMERLTGRTDSRLDDQLVPLLRKTLKVFVAVVITVMVIQNLGYSVTSVIASLGIGGLALALAAKDTVSNFFGSLVVFSDQPFHVGDWVEFDGVEGTVEEVGFRTTRVRRFDQSLATVPNQTFTSTTIVNHSRRPMRRLKFTVGVSYETSAEQMDQFVSSVRALVENHPAIDPGFRVVRFTEFGDSSLNVFIYCFTKTIVWTEFLAAQQDIMLSIMRLVHDQGLEIAYPTRTVYLRDEAWAQRGT